MMEKSTLGREDETPADARPAPVIPEEITQLLAERIGETPDIRLFFETDIDLEGHFQEGYVVATATHLYGFSLSEKRIAGLLCVPLETVERIHVLDYHGTAALQATTSERALLLARFTKARFDPAMQFRAEIRDLLPNAVDDDSFFGRRGAQKKRDDLCEQCGQPIPHWFGGICPNCLDKRRIIIRLLVRIRKYWHWVALGLFLMFLMTASGLVQPYLSKVLIDDVLPNKNKTLLFEILGVILGLSLFNAALSGLRGYLMSWFGEKVTLDLRQELYAHIQSLSVEFYDSKQTGWIMDRVSNDTGNLQDFLTDALQEAVRDIVQVVGIAVVLAMMSPKLALFTLLPVPFITWLSVRFIRRTHRMYHQMWRRRSLLTSLLSDVVPGVRVVKAFTQEDRETERFNERSQQYMNASLVTARYASFVWPTTHFLGSIGFATIWGYGGYLVITEQGVTPGVLFAFIGYLWQFYGPIHNLSRMSQRVQRAATAAQRVFEVLDTQPSVPEARTKREMPPIEGDVEFRDVVFSYEPHTPVLKGVSFTVHPGEMIGLVGPSGAGKSTTINLISRFYDVEEGAILIDGIDVRDVTLHSLRRQVGVVLQEPFLFHGSIADNIGYGKPEASLEEIITAAKAANAHEFIMRMPDGYDTMVGERGARLSGGERQRISIARAILKNPRILILDEATSSVDTETEAQIRQAIDRLVKNRTTFAIAHRFSTLRNADRLLVLEHGRVAEMGTHEELMAKEDGIFRRLTDVQSNLNQIIAVGG